MVIFNGAKAPLVMEVCSGRLKRANARFSLSGSRQNRHDSLLLAELQADIATVTKTNR